MRQPSAAADPCGISAARLTLPSTNGAVIAREVVFPVLATGLIVTYADVRVPLGLPGHRGLIWLTLLVAVALVTHRAQTVVAVGAACTIATVMVGGATNPWTDSRYLAAAILLYAVTEVATRRGRRWLIAPAAAPIHLVALAAPVVALIERGRLSAVVSTGMVEKMVYHLVFGLIAGLLAWALALGIEHSASAHLPSGESRR
ncbi:hypothetical protein [Mycobacterium sp.]|uniref:hypothetical protein n=1 Tax=Mycobacterium sp. TaxID=1785 RepID=UPI0039C9D05D